MEERNDPAAGRQRRWRRRRFLVNRQYQLRTTLVLVVMALGLLVFMNLYFYSENRKISEEIVSMAPDHGEYVEGQDKSMIRLILTGSIVFLLGILAIGILETHKTSGAALNIANRLSEVEQGKYRTSVRLRKGDNLREIEEPFNMMCRSLLDMAEHDGATLEALARRLEDSSNNPEHAAVVAELRRLARQKRALAE